MKELDDDKRVMMMIVPEKALEVLQKMRELRGQKIDGMKHANTEPLEGDLRYIRAGLALFQRSNEAGNEGRYQRLQYSVVELVNTRETLVEDDVRR